jgi:hypothetical protein
MTLSFEVSSTVQNAFGEFIVGKFLEKLSYFPTDQKFRLSTFELEIWGMPKEDVFTLKLVSSETFNWVLEDQIVKLEVL